MKYVICNADEGEPGTFKDRVILTKFAELVFEGMTIAAYAIGARHGIIYLRAEYAYLQPHLQQILQSRYESGLLGQNILGKNNFDFDIRIQMGAGAYICGEETALIESLEGKRGHPRLKPAGKESEWFFGNPATVNNVETIASVPNIVENGSEGYTKYGTEKSPGTMLFAISGPVKNPGVYEMEYGNKMIDFLNILGGGMIEGKKLKAIIPGGSSCPVLTAVEVEKAVLDHSSMSDIGSTLGTGGMIVIDEDTSMVDVAKNLIEFYHHESCGQCTPCREGTGWIDKILKKILKGDGSKEDLSTILDVCSTMNGKTVCVFAPAVKDIIESIVKKFPHEFNIYFKN